VEVLFQVLFGEAADPGITLQQVYVGVCGLDGLAQFGDFLVIAD
jgi:hypothetical protein